MLTPVTKVSMNQAEDFDFSSLATFHTELQNDAKSGTSPSVRRYLASLCNALESFENVSDDAQVILSTFIPNYYRFMSGYPKFRKTVFKTLVHIWSSGSDGSRLHASVALLKYCKSFPAQLETCARKMYLAFLKSIKAITAHNIHILSLMTNALMEIFMVNTEKLCLLVFSSVRKLADLVRLAIKDSSKQSLKKVFSWQFCGAMKLWTLLLGASNTEKMNSLIYPTITLVVELCCIQPSNFYGPFYLQMVRIALDLMEKKQVFIPVNHILGHMLKGICSKKLPAAAKIAGSSYCLSFMIKATPSDQSNPSYIEALFEDCHTLLMKYINITSTWVCFPEIGQNCQNLIHSVVADCPNKNFKSTLLLSKNKLNQLIDACLKARTDCELPPSSFDGNHIQENFAPVDFKAYVSSLDSIQKIKEQQVRNETTNAAKKAKAAANDGKNQSVPKNKRRRANVTKDDDKLVDFEL